jgi:hypothetical protein
MQCGEGTDLSRLKRVQIGLAFGCREGAIVGHFMPEPIHLLVDGSRPREDKSGMRTFVHPPPERPASPGVECPKVSTCFRQIQIDERPRMPGLARDGCRSLGLGEKRFGRCRKGSRCFLPTETMRKGQGARSTKRHGFQPLCHFCFNMTKGEEGVPDARVFVSLKTHTHCGIL